ncbi:SEC10/PgrA surface exclusion domain-containing protein [Limosilactobacillus sp.]|uniref:SEC10/PgrA surface exclusion domain-containing protein n=1 Tax=Limosilactobacillus sp. TaxID=2773925 RepID=UPI00345E2441
MLKSRKKLYKAKKNWLVATAITAGVMGGALLTTNNVHADVVAPAATNVAAQTAQSSQATQDQQELANQQQTLASQQAQQQQANSAANQANTDYNNATADQANAQNSVNSANTAQQNAQQAVNTAQNNYKQSVDQAANQRSQQANQTINSLKNKANGGQLAQIDKEIQDTNNQIKNGPSDVKKLQSQISDLQNQVKSLQDAQKQSTSKSFTVAGQTHTVDTTKSLLENAVRNNLWDSCYDNATSSNWNGNVIPENMYLSPDDNKGAGSGYAIPLTHDEIQNNTELQTYYNTLITDVDKVDPSTGMTDAQKQELAIMILNAINHVRAQRGLAPFTMTEQKYQQAQVRASSAVLRFDHNENDIINAFGKDQYENLGVIAAHDNDGSSSDGLLSGASSMFDLYQSALHTVDSMLNADADSDWGHRDNFLEDGNWNVGIGLGFATDNNTGNSMYAFTFDFVNSAEGDGDTTPNMMDRINQYAAMGPTTNDSTTPTFSDSSKIIELNNQIDQLKQNLHDLQVRLRVLPAHLVYLQAEKNSISFDINKLNASDQQAYNQAQNQLNTIDQWKQGQLANMGQDATVKSAQAKLDSANKALADAQTKLNAAKANTAAKLDALHKAQAKVNEVENAIAQTKSSIASLQAKIAQEAGSTTPTHPSTPSTSGSTTTPSTPSTSGSTTTPSTPSTSGSTTTPSTPSTSGSTTTPSTPSTSGSTTTPSTPSTSGSTTTPSTPSTSDNTTTPSTPSDSNSTTNPTTPSNSANTTNPSTPSNGGNTTTPTGTITTNTADTSNNNQGQAAHKPTVVLPTNGSESAVHGHYVNVDSSIATGSSEHTAMTREQYREQQGKTLPQTGNDNSVAITVLGVVAGMLGLGLAADKKRFN